MHKLNAMTPPKKLAPSKALPTAMERKQRGRVDRSVMFPVAASAADMPVDYAAWLAAQRTAEKAPEPDVAAEKAERLNQRAEAKANRQAVLAQRRPLLKEIEQLERKLAKWNEEKAALDAQFADPEFYATVDRVKSEDMHKQAGLLGEQIDAAEMRWLEVHEALEALPAVD